MGRMLHILSLLVAASAAPESFPEKPLYVGSQAMTLSFESANSAEIDQVNVWFSTDDGNTWNEGTVARTGRSAVRFDARQDGKYCFYLVLENKAGCSGDPPSGGSKPHVSVIVDTAPPTMQIHRAQPVMMPESDVQVRLNVSLAEENLGEAATRIFYRTSADAGWQDGGRAIFADGVIHWRPPAGAPPKGDLRLIVTDLAGNQASDEIRDISIGSPPLDASSLTARRGPTPSESPQTEVLEQVTLPPVRPVTLPTVPLVTLDEQPGPTPTTRPAPERERRARLLREQAARYLAEGRLSLAGARLHEALELAPNDPDLEAELGRVLYRARQYDEADRRFRSALETAPDHVGAIEGLALVAVTQNRYPQARAHLHHLLRLSPESAEHWLHYGDIAHKLGEVAEARAAWEKMLEIEPADETIREKAQKRLKLFGRRRSDEQ